jgi:hypothetical protein
VSAMDEAMPREAPAPSIPSEDGRPAPSSPEAVPAETAAPSPNTAIALRTSAVLQKARGRGLNLYHA